MEYLLSPEQFLYKNSYWETTEESNSSPLQLVRTWGLAITRFNK